MAVTLQTDLELIRPLEGAIIRRYTAGGTITAGQPVAMLAAGTIAMADGNGSDPIADFVIGCALKSAAAGDRAIRDTTASSRAPRLCSQAKTARFTATSVQVAQAMPGDRRESLRGINARERAPALAHAPDECAAGW